MSALRTPKKKYFTAEQANAMLPLLRLILRDIVGLARTLREHNRRLARMQETESATADELETAIADAEAVQDQLRPNLEELEQLQVELAGLPKATRRILFFVPYNHVLLASPGSLADMVWSECKRRVARLAADLPNTVALDFMRPSPITPMRSRSMGIKGPPGSTRPL